MSSHVPIPLTFTLLDSVGDSTFVLILVEATGVILNYWQEIKTYYLPFLLEAVGVGSKSRHVRVCWQLTSDLPGYNTVETQGQIPDFPFSPSTNAPVTLATLRRALEVIKSAPREHGWTRHLIVIGVSPPLHSEVAGSRHEPSMLSETHQAMSVALSEERIRMHMVLSAAQYMQPLRDLHDLLLRHQHSAAVPPWFQYDATRFSLHLSPQPLLHDSAMERVTRSNLLGTQAPIPAVSPPSRSPTQPLSSPVHEAPVHSLTPSPPSRRTRLKTKDSGSPPSPSATGSGPGGLVSFLQKAHGLSKKRASSAKVTKRTSGNEPSRPSTSSRPILPKLTLPQQTPVIGRSPDSGPRIAAHLEVASAVPSPASVSAYIATASDSASAQRDFAMGGTDEDRYPPGRWPFLKLMPMTAAHEGPGFGEGASAALRSLEALPPMSPAVGIRLTSEQGSPPRSTMSMYANMSRAMEPATHHAAYGAYEPTLSQHGNSMSGGYATNSSYVMTSSSPTTYAPPAGAPPGMARLPHDISPQSQGSPRSEMDSYPSPVHQHPGAMSRTSPLLQSAPHLGPALEIYAYPQLAMMHPYGVSPTASLSGTPLPSPSLTAPPGRVDEGEDQPFIVTPEYEAFANARFAEAIRSGAMQASMTPAALSPSIGSAQSSGSSEYFVGQGDRGLESGGGFQQISQSNYAYPGEEQQQHNGHQMYQQPSGMAMAPGSAQYYPTAGTPPPGPSWYGS